MRYKHKHKWVLEYTYAGTCGEGLLYHCKRGKCGSCKEFPKEEYNTEIHLAYRNEIKRLQELKGKIWNTN